MRTMQRFSVVGATVPARRGFTLVELLVVIAIMAILAALVTAAIQRSRSGSEVKTTESTLAKLDQGIDQQVKAINTGVTQEQRQKSAAYQTLVGYCDGDENRAVALLTYCRVKQAFPQSAADLAGFSVGGVNFPPPPAFANANLTTTISGDPNHVSAALLYVALTKRTIQGYTFPVDDAIGNASSDIDLGVPCRVFVDAWKKPIGFQRWFTAGELNGPPYANTKDPSIDPFDPRGRLASNWTNRTDAQNRLGIAFDSRINKKLMAYSAGVNGTYDGPGSDDIFSYKLKIGN